MEKLLSRTEAAKILGVSLPTFDRMCKTHQIPFVKLGRSVKVIPRELEEWVKSCSTGGHSDG